jgi:hypothetical protein
MAAITVSRNFKWQNCWFGINNTHSNDKQKRISWNFSIKFRSQIENQLSDYRLLEAIVFFAIYKKKCTNIKWNPVYGRVRRHICNQLVTSLPIVEVIKWQIHLHVQQTNHSFNILSCLSVLNNVDSK